jgi:hypothetical protein
MSSITKNKDQTGIIMKKKLTMAASLFGLLCTLQTQASTTWIPISVGDITTIIPYTPSGLFLAPANANASTVNGVSTLSWSDVEHASKFQIHALNSQGQWVVITTTESLSLTLAGNNAGYSSFRVVACNYSTCANTGSWSETIYLITPVRNIIFIHTDLLGSPVAETDLDGIVQ